MNNNRIPWLTFFILSLLSCAVWLKFTNPQLAVTNISVGRAEAVRIAEDYLRERGDAAIDSYRTAAVFHMDNGTNRYLQKTTGFEGLKKFIREHEYDMFFWIVRFFAENVKEEYHFRIDSGTGEITGFTHVIDDNDARREIKKDGALEKARNFLIKKFGFDPSRHTLRSDLATLRDNRSDFLFSWQKNGVNIPWSDRENTGTGKLVISATVSGDEILSFSKHSFVVPDRFNRDLDSQTEFGRNIMTIIKIVVLMLLIGGIYLIIVRQNHLAMHTTKKFYVGIMLFSFALSLLSGLNQFHHTLFSYSTTLFFSAFLWRVAIDTVMAALFITVMILIPGLAGELLHFETSPGQKRGSFLHYVRSTFASRSVGKYIVLGYFTAMIMLGVQSFLVRIGQTHLGVWVEHNWITNSSTAYLPFLAAFTFSFKTAFSEEVMYRLYAINLGKKIFNRAFSARGEGPLWFIVLLASVIWGFAHAGYPVFPMWFRGVEVTCLGVFLAFMYLKFGLIPVLVAHYVYNAFWSCAGYIFGIAKPFYFYGSLFVLLLPLMFAVAAFCINRKEEERPLRWHLNKRQLYNLEILKAFLRMNKDRHQGRSRDQIKKEITSHGWDPAVVDVATEDFFSNTG